MEKRQPDKVNTENDPLKSAASIYYFSFSLSRGNDYYCRVHLRVNRTWKKNEREGSRMIDSSCSAGGPSLLHFARIDRLSFLFCLCFWFSSHACPVNMATPVLLFSMMIICV